MRNLIGFRSLVRSVAQGHPAALQVLRVHFLRERAKQLFPDSPETLREKWVQARLRQRQYGCRRPRVLIGRAARMEIICPRTLREAGLSGEVE